MASWWTADDVLDELDLEQNPIMTRVIQAVGLFGDILSLEDTMETVLSADGQGSPSGEEEGSGRAGEERAGGCQDERVMADEERGLSETFKRGGMGERVIEGDNPGENGEMEKRKVEEEEEEDHNEGDKTRMSVNDAREEEEDRKKQGREEDKRDEVKETDEEQVETKEQQSKEERKDEELMTLEKENEVDTEGKGDEEAEEKGETTQEEVLKEERKDGRKHECDKHGDEEEEEELDKKKEGEKNKVKRERREMEKEQLDEGEETMATQASRKEKENDATLDGGETKLDPNQLKQTSNPPAEVHHGDADETGSEALSGDGDEGWDAAQDRDVCPESESVDKEPETTTASVAALRDPTAPSVTSLPAGHHSNREAGGPRGDVASDLQPGNQNLHFHHLTSSNSG